MAARQLTARPDRARLRWVGRHRTGRQTDDEALVERVATGTDAAGVLAIGVNPCVEVVPEARRTVVAHVVDAEGGKAAVVGRYRPLADACEGKRPVCAAAIKLNLDWLVGDGEGVGGNGWPRLPVPDEQSQCQEHPHSRRCEPQHAQRSLV